MTIVSSGAISLSAIAAEFKLPVTQNVTDATPAASTFAQIRNGSIATDTPVKIRTTNTALPIPTYTYAIAGLTSFSCDYYIFCTNNYTYAKFGYQLKYRIYQNGAWGSYSIALTNVTQKSNNATDFGPFTGTLSLYSGAKLPDDAQVEIVMNPYSDVSDATSMYWNISGQAGGQTGPFGGGSVGIESITYSRIYYPNERTGTFKLSDYYRGGSYVWDTTTNVGIPTTGAITFSNFYGTTQR